MYATHKVSFYGVRCYYNAKTDELWGVNSICDYGIFLAVMLHKFVCFSLPGYGVDGFPLRVIKTYEKR